MIELLGYWVISFWFLVFLLSVSSNSDSLMSKFLMPNAKFPKVYKITDLFSSQKRLFSHIVRGVNENLPIIDPGFWLKILVFCKEYRC